MLTQKSDQFNSKAYPDELNSTWRKNRTWRYLVNSFELHHFYRGFFENDFHNTVVNNIGKNGSLS
jgi:hypothetical protein